MEKLLWLAWGAFLAACVFHWFYAGHSGDKKWLLYATNAWLGGKSLYVDLIETNPPLIIFLYAVPTFFFRYLDVLASDQWLTLFTLAVGMVSIMLALTLLKCHAVAKDRALCIWAALLFIAIVLPHPSFVGDREYMLVMLCLPYFIRFLPALQDVVLPRRMQWFVGIMAGLGFCLKPHTLVLWLPVQCYWLIKRRALQPLFSLENRIIYAAAALYAATVAAFQPEYFSLVLPMGLASYAAYRTDVITLMTNLFPPAFALALLLVNARLRYSSPFRPDIYYLLALVAGGYVYTLINNGWAYTYFPLQAMVGLLAAWLYMEYGHLLRHVAEESSRRLARSGLACVWVCVFLGGLLAASFFVPSFEQARKVGRSYADGDPAVLDAMGKILVETQSKSFAGYSPSFAHWFNLTEHHRVQFASRFHSLWMITGFSQPWIAEYVQQATAEDLERNKPDVIFFDTSPAFQNGLPSMDLLAFFKSSPAFVNAWRHYRPARIIDTCVGNLGVNCRYAVYKRRG